MSTAQRNGGRRGGVVMDPFNLEVFDPLCLAGHMWDLNPSLGEMHNSYSDFRVPVHVPVDWLETEQTHILKANLPGLEKRDVKVQVEEGRVMHISGECKKTEVDKNDEWRLIERPHGTFSRRFRLPENVKLDQVKSNMTNGVLTLTVPKTAGSKPKVIPIDISEN